MNLIKVFGITILAALLCLALSFYSKYTLVDDDYIQFSLFISLYSLNNYFLLGAPECFMVRLKSDNGAHMVDIEVVKSIALISAVSMFLMLALLFYLRLLDDRSNIYLALIFSTSIFLPQTLITFLRLLLESQDRHVMSSIFRGGALVSIYTYPFFDSFDYYLLTMVIVNLLFATLMFSNIKVGLYHRGEKLLITVLDIFKRGFWINLLWMYTQAVPLVEKLIIVNYDKNFGAHFAFALDTVQRFSVFYGTLGQYVFAKLVRLKMSIVAFSHEVRTHALYIFLFWAAIICLIIFDYKYIEVYQLLPIPADVYGNIFIYLIAIAIGNSFLSIGIRPAFIVGTDFKLLIICVCLFAAELLTFKILSLFANIVLFAGFIISIRCLVEGAFSMKDYYGKRNSHQV